MGHLNPDCVLGVQAWKPARGKERDVCLLVGWEVPCLILLPAKRLAAVLQSGEGSSPPLHQLLSCVLGPKPEERFSLGQSSQEQEQSRLLLLGWMIPRGVLVGGFPPRPPSAGVSPE